ncbi:MAG: GNAT family N-acetyltransferase [Bacteroidia bacterium]|nr:GNAT family N-acetyltransferase [Bacteroidia bacterium]
MSHLENDTIRLRALEPSDLDLLYQWENDSSIWMVSNTPAPFSKYILSKYIKNSAQDIYQAKQLRLMLDIKKPDNLQCSTIGIIDIFDFDFFHLRAGIGIIISDKKSRNKGYAGKALKLLIDYAFNFLHLHQLFCNITIDNHTSLRLFQKYGFRITGKKLQWIRNQNTWLDEYILQLINK